MGTLTAQSVLQRVDALLNDPQNKFWTEQMQLRWLSDAQRLVVMAKPEQNTAMATMILVAGTRQSLPANKVRLVRVVRNMGTNGTTPGKAIRVVDMDHQNAIDPDWHSATAAAEVGGYMFDERAPTTFYVTPPQPGAGQGWIEYEAATEPAEVAGIQDVLTVNDIFVPVLVDYVVARCLSQESGEATLQKADHYYRNVSQALGLDSESIKQTSPNKEFSTNG